jgi:LysR family transcriptional regulator, glycine cleavage system transcriptional activator
MNRPRLSLDLLRGFHAAARHLSFTRAAQELCVTQSAISREVRTLEEQLGSALFRRVNRALQLTRAGQDLYGAVDEALGLIDAAAVRVAGAVRTVSMTTTVALASTWLVPRLPRFTRQHPEIDLRVVASNDMLDLDRERIDLAVRYRPPWVGSGGGQKLFDYQQFPVCIPEVATDPVRPLRSASDLPLHVLLEFENIVYGKPWYDWRTWFEAKGIRGVRPSHTLTFSHYDQVIEAALKGSGVAIGKRPHLIAHLRNGSLVAPLGEDGIATVGAFYLELATGTPSDSVEALSAWLQAEARESSHPPKN